MALNLIPHLLGAFLLLLATQPFLVQPRTLQAAESRSSSVSLQKLEGSQKGQTVKGLHELKRYLNKFGYFLNYNETDNVNLSDEFEEHLETAIKMYQQYNHLKITGIVDADTIKQMKIPRCGVPDTVGHHQTRSTGHNSSNFGMVADYAFLNGMPIWPFTMTSLSYTFRSSVSVVSLEELRPIMSRAFQRWADVSGFTFEEAPQGTQANIVIGFHRGDHEDGAPFDGPGKVVAHSFAPTNGNFHLDADENWSTTNPTTVQIDLESVAVHEIGHLLGLGHSMDHLEAIMYPILTPGITKRDLAQDDIQGITALYN